MVRLQVKPTKADLSDAYLMIYTAKPDATKWCTSTVREPAKKLHDADIECRLAERADG